MTAETIAKALGGRNTGLGWMFWRLRRLGVWLPAEPGVINVSGGRQ